MDPIQALLDKLYEYWGGRGWTPMEPPVGKAPVMGDPLLDEARELLQAVELTSTMDDVGFWSRRSELLNKLEARGGMMEVPQRSLHSDT